MVKLKGPVFSLEGRGKLGPLVYEKTKKTNYAKSNKQSKKKPSSAQKNRRKIYGLASIAWKRISQDQRDQWDLFASDKPGNGFNYFMQELLTAFETGIYGVNLYGVCSFGI